MTFPLIEITEKGVIAPTTDAVVAGLWDLFKQAFGDDLNIDMRTPQGQLVTSLAAMIQDERNQMIELLNMTDPRYSKGVWQEGIGNIYFLNRKRETYSTVELSVMGLRGVKVAAGTQFSDSLGYVWKTLNDVTIDESGIAAVKAECTTPGQISAAAHSINTLVKSISGIDRLTNPKAAQLGREEEGRIDFEERRRLSVALNAKNTNAATYGAVADIDGVVSLYVEDNPTDETVHSGITRYPLIRNSILVSVMGGDDYEIANTLLIKAGSGCSFNGNTEVIVKDTENFQIRPPTYKVKILRPTAVPVYFKIVLEDLSELSFHDESNIKDALIDATKSGKTKMNIGLPVIALRYVCRISAVADLVLESLRISRDGINFTDVLEFGVDEFPCTSGEYIEFVQ
ncbi:baseplate J/gp47 family protein [Acinetobacter larvae]|uniref:Baseplate protein J-like barrel domain-containing protein n=1 Tax=Acinetobacter larvae TaxID=1789224 RepID=A0A1B2LZK9_9GAMM|nr:baseplate J/gp47 family protein [Acinetobacter larvae]AOA58339.1 hypothetical protein BFG52_08210 [Acinetobacter larvae]